MTSSAASLTDSARNFVLGRAGTAHHLDAAATGQVHVEQHHLGLVRGDRGDRGVDVLRLGDDVDVGAELGAHAGPEHGVVVDDDDCRLVTTRSPPASGIRAVRRTSVPSPGVLPDLGGAAVAFHPVDDAAPQAVPVGRDRGRVEPDPPVPDEHLDLPRRHLGVHVDAAGARRAWPR